MRKHWKALTAITILIVLNLFLGRTGLSSISIAGEGYLAATPEADDGAVSVSGGNLTVPDETAEADTVSGGNITVSGGDMVMPEGTVASIKEGEIVQCFTSLEAALLAVADGQTIMLQKDITLEETLINNAEAVFSLDFNGHMLEFKGEAYFENNGHMNCLMDSAWQPDNNSTFGGMRRAGSSGAEGSLIGGTGQLDTIVSGRYETTSLKLIQTAGGLTVYNGYFRVYADSGSLFTIGNLLTINDGIFVSPEGALAKGGTGVKISGGAFVCGDTLWTDGKVTLPEGQVLSACQVTYDGATLSGKALAVASIKLLLGDAVFYSGDIATAWELGCTLSKENDNARVVLLPYGDNSQFAVESNQLILMEGSLALCNMTLQRGADYRESLITVCGGQLLLQNVTLNGTPDGGSGGEVNGSLLSLQGGSTVLNGIESGSTQLIGNKSANPGSGVYLSSAAQLSLQGNINIVGNTDLSGEQNNVYLPEGAQLIHGGAIDTGCVIGISHERSIVSGLTRIGTVESGYAETVKGAANPDALFSCYLRDTELSDAEPLYHIVYDGATNAMIWENPVQLLPESGVPSYALWLFAAGVLMAVLYFISRARKKSKCAVATCIGAFVCMIGALAISLYQYRIERNALLQNQLALENMQQEGLAVEKEYASLEIRNAAAKGGESMQLALEEPSEETVVECLFPQDGREYYGIIRIEELDIELPVLSNYSDADMKTTPCVYSGSLTLGDLVIVGHNYSTQFGKLLGIEEGTEISFTAQDGSVSVYQVIGTEELKPSDVKKMVTGAWDMTLFTCTYVGDKRFAVRCVEIQP